jgi:hypothetical protein
VASIQGTADDQLMALMDLILRKRIARHDIAIRAWAAHNETAARLVKQVDQARMDFVRSLLAALGFSGEELEMRTRCFVVYFSLESGLFVRQRRLNRTEQIERLYGFFTRP